MRGGLPAWNIPATRTTHGRGEGIFPQVGTLHPFQPTNQTDADDDALRYPENGSYVFPPTARWFPRPKGAVAATSVRRLLSKIINMFYRN